MKETARLYSSKENIKMTRYVLMNDDSLTIPSTIKLSDEDDQKYQNTSVKQKSCIKSFRGLILAITSGIFMSLTSVIVKKVNIFPALRDDLPNRINPIAVVYGLNYNLGSFPIRGELGFVRFLCIGIFALPLAINSQTKLFKNKTILILLLLRGFFDSFSIFFRFEAMQRLPLADANVIIFSSPVVVAVMARFILKERCSFYLFLSLLLTILGLTLVVKLPLINSEGGSLEFSSTFRILGVVYGFASVFFNASMFVVVRKIKKDLHRTVILFHLGWTASIISLTITASFGRFTMLNPVNFEPWWLLLMGVISFIGQLMLTAALQYEHAGPVSIARAGSDIVSAFFWQVIFFKEKLDAYSVSGAVMVTLGGIVLNLSKWVADLPETSTIKKNLKCLSF